jgi:prophage regulatory protein
MQDIPRRRVLRLPEVLLRTGKRRTSLLQAVRRGDFPRPIHLGPRAIGFVESEVEAWIDARMVERDGGAR